MAIGKDITSNLESQDDDITKHYDYPIQIVGDCDTRGKPLGNARGNWRLKSHRLEFDDRDLPGWQNGRGDYREKDSGGSLAEATLVDHHIRPAYQLADTLTHRARDGRRRKEVEAQAERLTTSGWRRQPDRSGGIVQEV